MPETEASGGNKIEDRAEREGGEGRRSRPCGVQGGGGAGWRWTGGREHREEENMESWAGGRDRLGRMRKGC